MGVIQHERRHNPFSDPTRGFAVSRILGQNIETTARRRSFKNLGEYERRDDNRDESDAFGRTDLFSMMSPRTAEMLHAYTVEHHVSLTEKNG